MAKAKREVQEKLKLVDFVMELVDARAPQSSQNPLLRDILQEKPKMVILMKKDLADDQQTKKWLHYFSSKHTPAVAINVNHKPDIQKVIELAKSLGQKNLEKLQKRGVQTRPARAMIIGIPNVGKSTLINRLANKKIAKTGDRPGITKHQTWIKVKSDFELLDTPGILWPKFEDQTVGYRLAAIGTIKDHLLSLQDIAAFVMTYLQDQYPSLIKQRYGIDADMEDMWDVFERIGKKQGALESGGHVNFDRVAEIVLNDLRTGRIGKITFEQAE